MLIPEPEQQLSESVRAASVRLVGQGGCGELRAASLDRAASELWFLLFELLFSLLFRSKKPRQQSQSRVPLWDKGREGSRHLAKMLHTYPLQHFTYMLLGTCVNSLC